MTRINTNIPSVIAQSNLNRSQADLQLRLERLSTGLRINRGKDDPAGLIISERITTDINGIDTAIRNGERASSMIATTESALAEINDLLNSIKGLIVEAANTGANSPEERAANQLQIDSAIQSITRISNTATFGGLKLLDGSLDYVLSGLDTSSITKASVSSASFVGSDTLSVNVDVLNSAQKGQLFLNGNVSPVLTGSLESSMTLKITGPRGVEEVSFVSGTSLTQVAAAINQRTSVTGVEATLIDPTDSSVGLIIQSDKYGSREFVSVDRVDAPNPDPFQLYKLDGNADFPGGGATFPWASIGTTLVAAERDEGRDVVALINGNLANGEGLKVSINSPSLALELLLDEDFAIDPTLTAEEFFVTGGGALFQLGPDITALQQANIGIQSTAGSNLGGTDVDGTLQFLTSLMKGKDNSIEESVRRGDFTAASDILDTAIDEISILRGRLGAFERNVLATNGRSLQTAFENLTASRSTIRDADFARETSELTRAQILQSSGTSVLALANQQAQSVLQLLG
jgi:Flagellin and related hook-associated proteins